MDRRREDPRHSRRHWQGRQGAVPRDALLGSGTPPHSQNEGEVPGKPAFRIDATADSEVVECTRDAAVWRAAQRARLGSSSIIVRMSSVRKLAAEAADNGLLTPEPAAGIQRVKSAKCRLYCFGLFADTC